MSRGATMVMVMNRVKVYTPYRLVTVTILWGFTSTRLGELLSCQHNHGQQKCDKASCLLLYLTREMWIKISRTLPKSCLNVRLCSWTAPGLVSNATAMVSMLQLFVSILQLFASMVQLNMLQLLQVCYRDTVCIHDLVSLCYTNPTVPWNQKMAASTAHTDLPSKQSIKRETATVKFWVQFREQRCLQSKGAVSFGHYRPCLWEEF